MYKHEPYYTMAVLTLKHCPVVMLKDLMVESALPVQRVLPTVSVDIQVTAPVWPLKIWKNPLKDKEPYRSQYIAF